MDIEDNESERPRVEDIYRVERRRLYQSIAQVPLPPPSPFTLYRILSFSFNAVVLSALGQSAAVAPTLSPPSLALIRN